LLLGNVAVNSAFPAWPLKHMAVLAMENGRFIDEFPIIKWMATGTRLLVGLPHYIDQM
jgi:hypothetical protein